jgi:hypothetical protein
MLFGQIFLDFPQVQQLGGLLSNFRNLVLKSFLFAFALLLLLLLERLL